MSTKLQKYKKITKQVRIDIQLHKQLKFEAISKNTVMSSLLNLIIKNYFDKNNETE
ncbi:MAG: hypothetical protein WC303_02925 [Candidatus Paceibacterota bacterium]|jgi:hypothetical protein